MVQKPRDPYNKDGACALPASRPPHFSQGPGDAKKRLPLRIPLLVSSNNKRVPGFKTRDPQLLTDIPLGRCLSVDVEVYAKKRPWNEPNFIALGGSGQSSIATRRTSPSCPSSIRMTAGSCSTSWLTPRRAARTLSERGVRKLVTQRSKRSTASRLME